MSDPNIDPVIDYDQFLSEHLDGCLDGDDLKTLNAELGRNALLRQHYECLLTDQKNLREMFRQSNLAASGLPGDFASNVVAEASRRRAVQSSVTVASSSESRRPRRMPFVGIISTAAAVLVIATLASRNPSDSELAQNGTESSLVPVDTASSIDYGASIRHFGRP